MTTQAIDVLMIGKMLIVSKIVLENQQQDYAHGNAQCKAKNIEYGKKFIPEKNADKELEMSLKHDGWFSGEKVDSAFVQQQCRAKKLVFYFRIE